MDGFQRLLEGTTRCLARVESNLLHRPLLAAVSGGLDSTVLAFVLARLQGEGRLPGPVHVAHVDHGTRVDSGANAQFVVDLADRLDLPIQVRRLRLDPSASEDAMRRARYAALEEMASEVGAGAILTGHHADDNIETVLFRMMRGTSYRGLAGIRDVRHTTSGRLLVRPMLGFRRTTLEQVQDAYGLPVWEDPTNRDLRYSRNLLRHRTIPALRADLGVGLDAALMVVARTARAATEIVEARATRILSERGRWVTPWRLELDLPRRPDTEDPFLRDALRQAYERLDGRGASPLGDWLDRAQALCGKSSGARLAGRAGRRAAPVAERTRAGLLLVHPERVPTPPDEPIGLAPDAGRVRFGATEWILDAWRHPEPPLHPPPRVHGPMRALVDPRGAPLPWRLRTVAAGDRFRPLGCAQDLDLRRYLARRGVPCFDRDRLPVLVDARGDVFWVPGVELGHAARLRLNTHRCVEIRAHRG